LRSYNLLTFKSQHEALTAWTLDELVGHYVNYRKQISPKDRLLPEEEFGLYAVSVRFPRELAERVPFQETGVPGVFDVVWGARKIRVVVLGDVSCHPRNAAWELFSLKTEMIRHGVRHYQFRFPEAHRLLCKLYLARKLEGLDMAFSIEEYAREGYQEMLQYILEDLSPEERLRGLAPEERLRGLAPEERLRGLAPEERLRGLAPEVLLQRIPLEERLRGLASEERLRGLAPEERLLGLSQEELQKLVKEALTKLRE
jgi:hypothetical protein